MMACLACTVLTSSSLCIFSFVLGERRFVLSFTQSIRYDRQPAMETINRPFYELKKWQYKIIEFNADAKEFVIPTIVDEELAKI